MVTVADNKMETNDDGPKPAKGLPNLGNTCFYNSTMQCLMHTHSLYKWVEVVTEKDKIYCPKGVTIVNEKKVEVPDVVINLSDCTMPMVNALQHFLSEYRIGKSPNPSPLFSSIAQKAPRFRGWQQQDAHELLRYLLDGIRMEEIKRFKDAIESVVDIQDKEQRYLMVKGILESVERCVVDSIFGGYLLQMIKCSECHHVSNSLEPFLDLSLPLSSNDDIAPPTIVPRNRREDTPSKHQSKKQLRAAKKLARKQAKLAKHNATETAENNIIYAPNQSTTDNEDIATTAEEAVEGGVVDTPMDSDDELKAIDGSPSESSDEAMLEMSDTENDLPSINGNVNDDYRETLAKPDENDEENTGRSLHNALKQFVTPENLCASNAYECEKCCAPNNKNLPANSKYKKTVEASKSYLIYAPPCVLTIHLKRFEQVPILTGFGNRVRTKKIRGHVEFPKILDIAQFCVKNGERYSSTQERVIYSLYGVVVHSGDLGGGHYIAYVRSRRRIDSLSEKFMKLGMKPIKITDLENQDNESNSQVPEISIDAANKHIGMLDDDSQWYYCSDSHVRPCEYNEVKNTEAYILFYERVM